MKFAEPETVQEAWLYVPPRLPLPEPICVILKVSVCIFYKIKKYTFYFYLFHSV